MIPFVLPYLFSVCTCAIDTNVNRLSLLLVINTVIEDELCWLLEIICVNSWPHSSGQINWNLRLWLSTLNIFFRFFLRSIRRTKIFQWLFLRLLLTSKLIIKIGPVLTTWKRFSFYEKCCQNMKIQVSFSFVYINFMFYFIDLLITKR
jgi:hypothetical protein